MDKSYEIRVRARAYEIWEQEGRPEGAEQRHWEQALRELGMEGGEQLDNGPPSSAITEPLLSNEVPGAAAAVTGGNPGTGAGNVVRAAGTARRARRAL